ncbi:DUF1232 domain-containing protein [Ectobacillus panaciterrae]|uniref:DUF1232 domain-containing protein n=1 Tax=Ectobacillus panaciterrae TaxID=363872 RepID=UPI00041254B4|nr:DUF1232 domain-containing protein [Ectobacillus panaciterrae]
MSEKNKEQNLGLLLKSLLKKHSLSMRKLSVLTGIDTATISRIVNGKQQAKLNHLQQFAYHLNISLEKLIEAAGFDVGGRKEELRSDIHYSVDSIQEILESFKLVDTQFTMARVEQELAKYEQYAQTEEGHRIICEGFKTKVEQVSSVGPFIEQLKQMYIQYCDDATLTTERAILGSALLYFILSADIIPDYVFPIGYLDDAIAVQFVLNRLAK